jgi:hypothetical protein
MPCENKGYTALEGIFVGRLVLANTRDPLGVIFLYENLKNGYYKGCGQL